MFPLNRFRHLTIRFFLISWMTHALVLGWGAIAIARIMSIVPVLMRWSLYIWATPLALIVIWFGISLALRISKSLIGGSAAY